MRRLYATRVNTRGPMSFVYIRKLMDAAFEDPVECIADVTDDCSLIFLVTCTDAAYDNFKNLCIACHLDSEWVEFDYFNTNS